MIQDIYNFRKAVAGIQISQGFGVIGRLIG